MVYDAIHKRIPYVEAIGKGLEKYCILGFVEHFPEAMKSAFVSDGSLVPADVLKIIKPSFTVDNETTL